MALFKKQKNQKLSYKERSENAVGVFKKTVNELELINSEMDLDQESIKMQIEELQREYDSIENQKLTNANFIGKIKTFLEL